MQHFITRIAPALNDAFHLAGNPGLIASRLASRMERGDSDSSGSTIRTLFVVVLVSMVMPVITIALIRLADVAANHITAAPPLP